MSHGRKHERGLKVSGSGLRRHTLWASIIIPICPRFRIPRMNFNTNLRSCLGLRTSRLVSGLKVAGFCGQLEAPSGRICSEPILRGSAPAKADGLHAWNIKRETSLEVSKSLLHGRQELQKPGSQHQDYM